MSVLFVSLYGLIGCGSEDKVTEELVWTKDIQPLVEQHCTRCHQPNGQGTGDFTDFDTVSAMSTLMLNAIDAGTMPPPAANPDCHDYKDSDKMHVSQETRDMIATWMENGMPYGDEADALTYDRSDSQIEDPDLIVKLTEPYTPTFTDANNPKNEYRCFALKHNQTENFYIKELHPIVDNAAMVHHIVLAKGNDNGILEGSDAVEGIDCIRDGAFVTGSYTDSAMLSGWAPGMSPIRFPDNAGLLVRPNEYIVIQMHYYQSASLEENASDQSGYAFKITQEMPENVVQMIPLGIHDFTIPAGDAEYTVSDSFNMPISGQIWGIFPHMHILGKGYEMSVDDQCIMQSDNYDFNNQLTYMFENPIQINADSRISISCTWDNSAENPNQTHNPPSDVYYGERTDEEMCYAFSLISL